MRGADPELPAHFQRGLPAHRDRVGHLSARWTLLRRAARACLERAVALADPATALEAVFGRAGFRVWVAVPPRETPASGGVGGCKGTFQRVKGTLCDKRRWRIQKLRDLALYGSLSPMVSLVVVVRGCRGRERHRLCGLR